MLSAMSDDRVRLQAQKAFVTPKKQISLKNILPFIGPAMIAAVAYIDPGNFATNIEAGSRYGYSLLWVILFANIMAMLIQTLSVRLGLATGKNLPQLIRQHYSPKVVWFYWVQAEIVAIATDLAEFLGASLAFNLLFGMSLFEGALLTGVITYAVLYLQRYGFRTLELVIAAMIMAVSLGFAFQLVSTQPDSHAVLQGLVIPQFPDSYAVYLAAGMLGATVMPHVIYLHSALAQNRIITGNDAHRITAMRYYRLDVFIGMSLAGLINMAILLLAAAVFFSRGEHNIASISDSYKLLTIVPGETLPQIIFGVTLLISGLSSSIVGTLSGQVIMQGFVQFTIPLWLRRAITMVPALVIIMLGLSEQKVLVFSQVILSFGIPFALIPLVYFTAKKSLMGNLVNQKWVTFCGVLSAVVIIVLNIYVISYSLLA